MTRKDFSARLLELRRARRWTQTEAAERCGVSAAVYFNWERGKTSLPKRIQTKRNIARAFDIGIDELFDIRDDGVKIGHEDRIAIRRGFALYCIRLPRDVALRKLAEIYRVKEEDIEHVLKTTTKIEKALIRRIVDEWEKDERKCYRDILVGL